METELFTSENNVRLFGLTSMPAIPGGPAGPRSPCWGLKKIGTYNDIYKIFTYKLELK